MTVGIDPARTVANVVADLHAAPLLRCAFGGRGPTSSTARSTPSSALRSRAAATPRSPRSPSSGWAARGGADGTGFESTTAAALLERLEAGDEVVSDVRPEEEYRAGHIPGARSIPVGELAARLAEPPLDATVVAYCRGPYGVMSYDALALLKAHGRRGVRLAEGLPDWREAGHAVDVVPDRA